MKKLSKFCCIACAVCFLFACSTKRVILDPVNIKANPFGANVYHASETRLTDIIHTKLDLTFNFDSSLVVGKASITAEPYFYSSDKLILDALGYRINAVTLLNKENPKKLDYSYDGK